MNIKLYLKPVLAWALCAALLVIFLLGAGKAKLQEDIRQQVGEHLLLTLDASDFGNAQGRVNDREALAETARQINTSMAGLVADRWYAPWKQCAVQILRIDDVMLGESAMRWEVPFVLPRNGIDREAVIGVSCAPGYSIAAVAAGTLGLLFALIGLVLPPPLSAVHRQWLDYLLDRGYSEAESLALVRGVNGELLALNPTQRACLDQLHDREEQDFSRVLDIVNDPRVAQLSLSQAQWFLLGMQRDPDDVAGALALAQAQDDMHIDLVQGRLSIRGLDIPVSQTPLFYLAWYGMSCQKGDGWVTNPPSNRPDREVGAEIAALMSRFDGHARAINDLESAGLKARTLDQNRSKIKDEIVATLGEELAAGYLFETSKHPDGIRMRYRLGLEGGEIRLTQ